MESTSYLELARKKLSRLRTFLVIMQVVICVSLWRVMTSLEIGIELAISAVAVLAGLCILISWVAYQHLLWQKTEALEELDQ